MTRRRRWLLTKLVTHDDWHDLRTLRLPNGQLPRKTLRDLRLLGLADQAWDRYADGWSDFWKITEAGRTALMTADGG